MEMLGEKKRKTFILPNQEDESENLKDRNDNWFQNESHFTFGSIVL